MRVLIVDDEAPARTRLRQLLADIGIGECVGEAASGIEALELAQELGPDVVLLDVRMPGISGLEAARHLAALESPPAVIFTTAYDEYALEAFETHAAGYLMKPIREEKLAAALERAQRPTRAQLARLGGGERQRTQLAVRVRDRLRLIPVSDVLAFVADQKYVTVVHRGGEDLLDDSLKSLEEEFGAAFVRIHRNALVAVEHIEALERDDEGAFRVRLRGRAETFEVSRRLAPDVARRLKG